jgi:23S rRNA (cytosine1962-C5)-methyltransferase
MTEPLFVLPLIQDEDTSSPFVNCMRKKYRHIRKWAYRTTTNCFRIFDRDIKEYPLAIDFYDNRYAVQFFSYNRMDDEPPKEVIEEIEQALHQLLDVSTEQIFWKTRIRRTKLQQYEKNEADMAHNARFVVFEHGVRFWVNMENYLDTGLFLDHRQTRQIVAAQVKGKKLLNLFAYTCAFSVVAASVGASFTKSVDLSNTYSSWGRDNFLLNGLSILNNVVTRADCLRFLDEERESRQRYDVIVIDPPTISRSKKMDDLFDIQKDYPMLLQKAELLLAEEGVIFFSTNFRKFHFDEELFPNLQIVEITAKTIPLDFHNQKIHRCWMGKKRINRYRHV